MLYEVITPSKPSKLSLVWLQGVTCNGNSHSFLNLAYLSQLLEHFKVIYHPLLPSVHTLHVITSYSIHYTKLYDL